MKSDAIIHHSVVIAIVVDQDSSTSPMSDEQELSIERKRPRTEGGSVTTDEAIRALVLRLEEKDKKIHELEQLVLRKQRSDLMSSERADKIYEVVESAWICVRKL
jgi:hypothetical protein